MTAGASANSPAGSPGSDQGSAKTTNSRHWLHQPSVWIGLVISVISVAVLFSLINWADLLVKLQQADIRFILAGLLALCISPYLRGVRWQSILGWHVNFWKPFHADNIGYLINSVLPLRAGEPARAYIVSLAEPGLSVWEALSTVVVARLVDMIAVIVMLGLVLPALDTPELIKAGGYSLLVLVSLAVVVLIVGAFARDWLIGLMRAIVSRLLPVALVTRLVDWADEFLRGLAVLRSPQRLLWLAISTAALWLVYLAFYYLILMAFWPTPSLAWAALVACAAALSTAVPSSPAYIGVFHAAVAFALTPYLGTDRAVAYAIVVHAGELLITVVFGLYGLAATGTSLVRVNAAATDLSRAETETARPPQI